MSVDPNTDTHSPWYECFEPQAQLEEAAAPAAELPGLTPLADAYDGDGAWAMDALFDYYNA